MNRPFKDLKELADHLGLSVTTISRVLNGRAREGRISESTEKRVRRVVEERGVLQNAVAKGLKSSRTLTIGLLIPDMANPFFATIAKEIVRVSREDGYSVLLCENGEDEDQERTQLNLLTERKVDGIIGAPVGRHPDQWKTIQSRGIPLCLVDRYFPDADIPFVSSDNHQGGQLALQCLARHGHRSVAMIQGDPQTIANSERIRGAMEIIRATGMICKESWILGSDFGEANGYRCGKILLSNPQHPTSIFAFSNMIAVGLLKAAQELNVRIGRDLSLISFDEQQYSGLLNPPLATIAQDRETIGRKVVNSLLQLIEGEKSVPSQLVPTRLIIRQSVQPA